MLPIHTQSTGVPIHGYISRDKYIRLKGTLHEFGAGVQLIYVACCDGLAVVEESIKDGLPFNVAKRPLNGQILDQGLIHDVNLFFPHGTGTIQLHKGLVEGVSKIAKSGGKMSKRTWTVKPFFTDLRVTMKVQQIIMYEGL